MKYGISDVRPDQASKGQKEECEVMTVLELLGTSAGNTRGDGLRSLQNI